MPHIGYAAIPVIRAPTGPDDHVPWHAQLTVGVPLEQALAAATAAPSEAVHAHINHGRWVVDCPACGGAQLGCPTDRRFMCNECANLAIGGLWRPVVWPRHAAQIGAIIAERADVTMRNYEPGETLEELREQNRLLEDAVELGGIRILPVVETDGDKGAVASEHEGHEHQWPKRVEPRTDYECPGCGLTLRGESIRKARDEARTPAEQAQDERVAREKGERS